MWRAIDDDVLLSVGPQLIRLSAERGIVWNQVVDGCERFYDLDADSEAIAGSFLGEQDAVVLLDPRTGVETWRQPLPRNNSRAARYSRSTARYDVYLAKDRVLATELGRLNAFQRETGKPLFQVKIGSSYPSMRYGDKIVFFSRSSMSSKIEAFAVSDGRELWGHKYLTQQGKQNRLAAATASIQAGTMSMEGWTLSPGYSQALYEMYKSDWEMPTEPLLPSGGTVPSQLYFLSIGNKKVSRPVTVAVDLETGTERVHRLLRSGTRCLTSISPFEAGGYLIQAFYGGPFGCSDFSRRIHALRIPAD
ncbi:MAG: PQQ-binding-like beta-propeller repeat protein [Myxococcales bacterium]|nr:PQQ-binding-like beta-propeller repeat protein [Myxococcales bacterium]